MASRFWVSPLYVFASSNGHASCSLHYNRNSIWYKKIPLPMFSKKGANQRRDVDLQILTLPRLSGVSTGSSGETTSERIAGLLSPPFTHLRLGHENNSKLPQGTRHVCLPYPPRSRSKSHNSIRFPLQLKDTSYLEILPDKLNATDCSPLNIPIDTIPV